MKPENKRGREAVRQQQRRCYLKRRLAVQRAERPGAESSHRDGKKRRRELVWGLPCLPVCLPLFHHPLSASPQLILIRHAFLFLSSLYKDGEIRAALHEVRLVCSSHFDSFNVRLPNVCALLHIQLGDRRCESVL